LLYAFQSRCLIVDNRVVNARADYDDENNADYGSTKNEWPAADVVRIKAL
jgi:hypothetical protein